MSFLGLSYVFSMFILCSFYVYLMSFLGLSYVVSRFILCRF